MSNNSTTTSTEGCVCKFDSACVIAEAKVKKLETKIKIMKKAKIAQNKELAYYKRILKITEKEIQPGESG